MRFVVRVDQEERNVVIHRENGIYTVELDGKSVRVDCRRFGDADYLSMLIDNRSYLVETAPVTPDRGKYYARVFGRHYDVEVLDELLYAAVQAEEEHAHSGSLTVVAPMPGRVVDVKVGVGDTVVQGQPLVVMEAMKMQNELASTVAGTVTGIEVENQQTVESGAALVIIERE